MKKYTIGLLGAFIHLIGIIFLSSVLYLLPQNPWGYLVLAIAMIFLGYDWWQILTEKQNLTEKISWKWLAIFDVVVLLLFLIIWFIEVPALKGEDKTFWNNLKNFFIFLFLLGLFINFVYRNYIGFYLYNLIYQKANIQIQFRKSLNQVVFLIVILVLINILLVKWEITWDITPGYYSISSKSKEIIRNIKGQNIKIFVFLPDQQMVVSKRDTTTAELFNFSEELRILFQEIPKINPEIQVEIYNADLIESNHQVFGNVSNGTIMIRNYKSELTTLPYLERRFYVFTESDMENLEQNLIRSLLQVASEPIKVYFSTALGERFTSPHKKPFQIDLFVDVLKVYNFEIYEWNENSGFPRSIPENAQILVFAGAQFPFPEELKTTLIDYISNKKGKVLILADSSGKENYDWLFQAFSNFYRYEKVPLHQLEGNPQLLYTDQISIIDLTQNIKTFDKPKFLLHGGGYLKKRITEESSQHKDYITKEFLFTTYTTWVDVNRNGKKDNLQEEENNRFPLGVLIYKEDSKIVFYSDVEWITNRYLSQNIYNLNLQLMTDTLFYLGNRMEVPGILEERREKQSILLEDTTKTQILVFGIIIIPLSMMGSVGFLIFLYNKRHRPIENL
ncbi:MAG: GldG family protein [Leptospiraceae bacterium]|nr:GldG family protein [Leptospiraceae bacterium]MDW7976836.1 hypothetical protein [Leptospiraceae bacterium]